MVKSNKLVYIVKSRELEVSESLTVKKIWFLNVTEGGAAKKCIPALEFQVGIHLVREQ